MSDQVKTGSEYFHFKHFKLRNTHSALKVNTDGVLLAAWTELEANTTCLDIGTGSGVIALILNYRYPFNTFTAIDIDRLSFEEASYNFKLNQKSIACHHKDFREFRPNTTFDHFVSNPPFFGSSTLPHDSKDIVSKHQETLTMQSLWKGVETLSSENARFSLIVPQSSHELFDSYGKEHGFGLKRQTMVQGKKDGKIVRVLKEYQKGYSSLIDENTIHIRDEDNGGFGNEYKELCKDLYLDF